MASDLSLLTTKGLVPQANAAGFRAAQQALQAASAKSAGVRKSSHRDAAAATWVSRTYPVTNPCDSDGFRQRRGREKSGQRAVPRQSRRVCASARTRHFTRRPFTSAVRTTQRNTSNCTVAFIVLIRGLWRLAKEFAKATPQRPSATLPRAHRSTSRVIAEKECRLPRVDLGPQPLGVAVERRKKQASFACTGRI